MKSDRNSHLDVNYEYSNCQNITAETVVLVHGLGLDLTIWDEVMPSLAKEFNVLRFDLPAHGKSTFQFEEPITWEVLLNVFEDLLEQLNISEFHLIGHSAGGNFGIEVAHTLGDRLQSLTLVSTPLFIPKELGVKEMENRLSKLREQEMDIVIDSLIQNICYPLTKEKSARLYTMYNQISNADYTNYFNLIGEKLLTYSREKIQEINIPMLMLIGEYDVLYPPQLQMLNMSYLNNTRFLIIPEASNVIMMDQPTEFCHFVIPFINKSIEQTTQKRNKYVYSKELRKKLRAIVETGIEQVDTHNTIRINMIDRFQVIINGKEVEGKWNQRKAKQLLTFLAMRNNVTRQKLIDVFWPNQEIDKARNHLRVALNHLKSLLEAQLGKDIESILSIERETIELRSQVEMDLMELIALLDAAEKNENTQTDIAQIIEYLNRLPETIFSSFYDDEILKVRTVVEDRIIQVCENLLEECSCEEDIINLLIILIKYNSAEELYFKQLQRLLEKHGRESELDIYLKN